MIQFPTLPPSTSDEALLLQLIALRRQRKEIDMRIRELSGVVARDPNARPCECLRCGYTWYPKCADITPKCCSQCGSEHWDIPPTATSRRPGDPPAPSWTRRKRKQRRPPAEPIEGNGNGAPWRGPDAPVLLSEQYMPPSPAVAHVAKVAASFPPPPDIRTVLPPPPDPAQVSLSARLAQYRARDESPEQPERTVSLPPPPAAEVETEVMPSGAADTITSAITELPEAPAGDHAEPATVTSVEPNFETKNYEANVIVTPNPDGPAKVEIEFPEQVPPESVGAPVSDAEREELQRSKEEAWPTTRSE